MIMPAKIIRWRQPPGSLSTPPPLSTPLRQATHTHTASRATNHMRRPENISACRPACQTGRPNHPGRFPPSRKPFQGQVKTQESALRKERERRRERERERERRLYSIAFREKNGSIRFCQIEPSAPFVDSLSARYFYLFERFNTRTTLD